MARQNYKPLQGKPLNRRLFAVLALGLASFAHAEPTCPDFDAAIDKLTKNIALSSAEGLVENSAPRQTNRELRINNQLQLININLSLMAQNKCAARKAPVNPMVYLSEALDCATAQLKGEQDSPACDMTKWKGTAR